MTRWAASVLLILLVLDLMMVITLSTRWKGYRERYLGRRAPLLKEEDDGP